MKNPFLIFCGLLFISQAVPSQTLTYSENDQGLLVKEGSREVFFYQQETKSQNGTAPRANYIHPLYGMDGTILTEDFPADHPHHRGIFWAWHQLIIGDKDVGDSWECRDFKWDLENMDISAQKDGSLVLDLKGLWKSPLWTDTSGVMQPFLLENTTIRVYPAKDTYRVLTFEIALSALAESVWIGGSVDEKGYGGFSVRMKLPEDIQFNSLNGAVIPATVPITAGRWMDISGSLTKKGQKAGVVLVSYPGQPGNQEQWILRTTESMQNIPFPGQEPVLIPDKDPLKLRYGIIVYTGDISPEQIESIYQSFQNESPIQKPLKH